MSEKEHVAFWENALMQAQSSEDQDDYEYGFYAYDEEY